MLSKAVKGMLSLNRKHKCYDDFNKVERMTPVCLNSNIVFVFDRVLYEDFNNTEIKEKIKNVYRDQDPDIGEASLGQFKSVVSLPLSLQVTAQGQHLIVASSRINETNKFTDKDFLRLTYNIQELLAASKLKVKHYGFNLFFNLQTDDLDSTISAIQTKYFKSDTFDETETVRYMLPSISFVKDKKIYSLRFDADQGDDASLLRVNVATNAHLQDSSPSNVDRFIDEFSDNYTYLYNYLGALA
jgi:hypothetical protein